MAVPAELGGCLTHHTHSGIPAECVAITGVRELNMLEAVHDLGERERQQELNQKPPPTRAAVLRELSVAHGKTVRHRRPLPGPETAVFGC